jgi:hypothetical protein
MKTAHSQTSAHATVTTPAPSSLGPVGRRADRALHPATPLEALVCCAIDQELEWYHVYAERLLHHDRVGMLPSYAILSVANAAASDEGCRVRAQELARTVRACLHALPGRHASVLRAVYTPRRWPKAVESAFDVLTPIAVRLAFAEDPWPPRLSAHTGLEEAAACRLSAALRDPARFKVGKLKAQAERLLGKAVSAYAKARASALVPTLGGA